MLPEESKKTLSELGFDVSALTEAITSESEIAVQIPTLYKETGHSKEELSVFGKNRFDEGLKANEEILAKTFHDEYGLDLPDGKEGRKNLKKVFEAYGAKAASSSKSKEDKTDDFKALQEKYQLLEKEKERLIEGYETESFQSNVKQTFLGLIKGETSTAKEDIIDLYLLRNKIQRSETGAVIVENGEVLKNDLLNPVKVEDHFKTWLDSKGFVKQQGLNEGEKGGGGASAKFSNASEFTDWCKTNKKDPMSDEMQKYYLANRKK